MAFSNHQYLDRLANIGKHYRNAEGVPDSSRQLFGKASDMAEVYSRGPVDLSSDPVDETFLVLCAACKAAGLHRCEESRDPFLACRLVWDYTE